mgnify:CR=1 FL=1
MKTSLNFYKNRELLIVTKHNKEKIIAPLFENEFDVKCFLSKKFDTDSLGTFSGEIPRKSDPLETLRQKCLQAMQLEGFDLAIATEGSFGNHPSVFFATANDELILLMDKKNNMEIVERVLSLETNFYAQEIHSKDALVSFLEKVQFPSHGIIIKDKEKDWKRIEKGIVDFETIESYYEAFSKNGNSCFVETDMRASYNPTRMKVIKDVSLKLIDKINSLCPHCNSPGFGVFSAQPGLLCNSCAKPTKSTVAHIYKCLRCLHEEKRLHPNGKLTENPMYCDFCNP